MIEYFVGLVLLCLAFYVFIKVVSARKSLHIKLLSTTIYCYLVYCFFSNYYVVFSIQDPEEKHIYLAELFKFIFFTDYHLFVFTAICLYIAYIVSSNNYPCYKNDYEFFSVVQSCYFLFYLPKLPENCIMLIILAQFILILLQIIFNHLSPLVLVYIFLIYLAKNLISFYFPFLAFEDLFYIFFWIFIPFCVKSFGTLYYIIFELILHYEVTDHFNEIREVFCVPECFNKFVAIKDIKKFRNSYWNYIWVLYVFSIAYWIFIELGFEDDGTGILKMGVLFGISIPNSIFLSLSMKNHNQSTFINNIFAGILGLWCFEYVLSY